MSALDEALSRLEADAQTLEGYGDARGAMSLRVAAARVRAAITEDRGRVVNLTEAAEVSGYSARHLRNLVRDGVLEDLGRHGAPQFRVADLPRKPGSEADRFNADAVAGGVLRAVDTTEEAA